MEIEKKKKKEIKLHMQKLFLRIKKKFLFV